MRKAILALVMICCGTGSARAADINFITIDVAPWASVETPDGAPTGVFPQVVAELQRRTGHRIAVALHPFARIDRELEAGTQDCTIIVWNEARSAIVKRGELIAYHQVGVVAAKGVPLTQYEDLYRLKGVSVLRGLALDPRFDTDAKVVKEFDTDYITGIRKLAHHRLDGVAGAVATIQHLARRDGQDGALGDVLPLGRVELVLQCSLKSRHLDRIEDFNQAIRDMRQDGTLDRIIRDNYFS